ncbi:DUF305 domain-containing protein [Allorhizocola rhizosphaerae]|uniref:DUF305 domain-containing protein n=1 Tax=Allorhizocola rhizosphaerae TaxID=1872709 RepID=UPI000E3C8158|nr:DUF305 domain-containing protein [Allorhizocola rhizosphaerae]
MTRLGILVTTVLLGACATAPPTPAPMATSSQFNPTDVMFLQMLIAHHGPAERMLEVAKSRARRPDLRDLAEAIAKTQADETRAMTDWLRLWNQPVAMDSNPDSHAHHGGLPPSYDTQINALKEAPDADFDRVFLNLFIEYQRRALELARFEIRGGSNPQAVELAGRVEKSRQGQIDLMSGYPA